MNIHIDGFHCTSTDMNDLAIAAIDAFARARTPAIVLKHVAKLKHCQLATYMHTNIHIDGCGAGHCTSTDMNDLAIAVSTHSRESWLPKHELVIKRPFPATRPHQLWAQNKKQ